ncbi:23830_t:CDS:2, partial [Racocetra persica]
NTLSDINIKITIYDQKNSEAVQIRFTSKCLCFIFKLADNYAKSLEYKIKVLSIPEDKYLKDVITSLYKYIRVQNYEIINR